MAQIPLGIPQFAQFPSGSLESQHFPISSLAILPQHGYEKRREVLMRSCLEKVVGFEDEEDLVEQADLLP